MSVHNMNTKHLWSLIMSLSIALFGVVIIFLTPYLLQILIRANLILAPKTQIFNLWKHFPSLVPSDFYFFNWTNPEDIYNLSVQPKFEQVGPYRFMLNLDKTDIHWNDNGTVTYKPQNYWYYDQNKSNGNLSDKVTTLNPIALAAAHRARTWPYVIRRGLSISLSGISSTVSITRTVDEYLFTGYLDPLVKIARTFPFFAGTELPPWDRFGWFHTRNGSNLIDGVYNVGTGNGTTFAKLYSWNYFSKSPYFESKCAEFGGSTGENFDPESLGEFIKVFSPEMCRPVLLQRGNTAQVRGVLGQKYFFGDHMLDNGTKYPENKCFCNGDCLPSGVFNVSSCRYGSPAFGSLPHFHKADPYFNSLIVGSQPENGKHDFYVIVEPNTGIPLEARIRVQLNMMIHSIPGVTMYEKVPKVFFPIMWFDQQINVPSDINNLLKLLQNIPLICTGIGIFLVVLGLSLSVYLAVLEMKRKKVASKTERCCENVIIKPEEKNLLQ